jgi:hypothetical protein
MGHTVEIGRVTYRSACSRPCVPAEQEGSMRAVVVGAAMMATLVGCGSQSRVVPLKQLTPSEARNLVKSVTPVCDKPGRVLIRYVSTVVHGKGSESWWCVAAAQSYRAVRRDVHCPAGTRLRIDLQRHLATCENSN